MITFTSDTVIESIIQRIVANVGRRIDRSQPLVDARLSDGSRVNAVIAPLAVSGPTLTIRKFPERKLIVDDLIAKGALKDHRIHIMGWLLDVVLRRRTLPPELMVWHNAEDNKIFVLMCDLWNINSHIKTDILDSLESRQ